jgi:hypothetical protein
MLPSDESTPTLQVNDGSGSIDIELDSVYLEDKRPSFLDMIKEKQNDQDFKQKLSVASTLALEIYRVLMGAFLVVFVP